MILSCSAHIFLSLLRKYLRRKLGTGSEQNHVLCMIPLKSILLLNGSPTRVSVWPSTLWASSNTTPCHITTRREGLALTHSPPMKNPPHNNTGAVDDCLVIRCCWSVVVDGS